MPTSLHRDLPDGRVVLTVWVAGRSCSASLILGDLYGLVTRVQLAAPKLSTGWSSMPFVATPP